jgi:flagellar operon protein
MTSVEHNPALLPPGGLAPASPAPSAPAAGGASFADVLRTQQESPVRFSSHAMQRAQRRGIDLGPETLGRLNAGVELASAKGSRSSVVLVDSTAFVVAVPNRTVVTAVDREHMKEQVFTNIDSAVIA